MMQFSCHTWGFNDKPLTEALVTIARLGFRYVDIASGPHLDVVQASSNPGKFASAIQRDLDRFNLRVSDLYLLLPRISVADDERRKHEIESFKALLPFAAALKTPGITVSPGIAGQGDDDAVTARVTDALKRFVEMAAEENIVLSIEPHLDSVADTPEKALKLVNAVEGLQITLDWAHMIAQGLRTEAVASLLPYTRHVHVRQAAPLRLQTPFEQGVLDIQRVMTLLLSAGYDNVIAIEIMQTEGWHGVTKVNSILEAIQLRDALRDVRDSFANR